MKWPFLSVLYFVLLASGCQSEKDDSPIYVTTFARQQHSGETIKGTIGGKEAEMTFSLVGDDIEGQVFFTSTQTLRNIKGKVSYEGFFRLKAYPIDDNTPSPVPSTAKGVFLTNSNLVGVWQGPYSDEPDFIDLGHPQDHAYYNFEDASSGVESVKLSHWLRQVNCIAQSGDTTGALLFEVPQLAVERSDHNWPMVYWTLIKSLIYQPGCTCQALAKQGGGTLRRRLVEPNMSGSVLTMDLVETLKGIETQRNTLQLDLETGVLLP